MRAQDDLVIPSRSHDVNISSTDDDLTQATEFVGYDGGGKYARRLYVGTGGNVYAKKLGDSAVHAYLNVPSGSYLDGAWILVQKTNTTAANMVAEQ